MNHLNTSNPQALQYLLTETLFDVGMNVQAAAQADVPHPAKPAAEIPFLGKNGKHILFVLSNEEHPFFSQAAELAFVKTLHALKLTLDDVAVINLFQMERPVVFERIRKKFQPSSCIFLGSEPSEAGLDAMAEHLWKEEGGLRLLKSYGFEEMLTDNQKKRMFWDTIKLMKSE